MIKAEPEEETIASRKTRARTKSSRTRSLANAAIEGVDRKKLIKVLAIVAAGAGKSGSYKD